MIAFAWSTKSVKDKITDLEKQKDRQRATKAYDFLMHSAHSAYKGFVESHRKFLRRNGEDASEKVRKRPLRFIETEGLECALWPQLYWRKELCETTVRASHEARRKRRRDDSSDEESGDTSDDEGDISCTKLGSIKRSFMRKVLSPVIGYSDYELLHFVYDLSMWTTVGTKKNVASRWGTPLRLILKNAPWTPEYWRTRHKAVIDMQRQCGNARLFRTRAPYEKSFPYHQWVMDEMQKTLAPRMHRAGPETLHRAHVLLEMDKGFFSGDKHWSTSKSRTWEGHILGPQDPNGPNTVVNRVTRIEFQDGKRKRATQDYHGRGTDHSHSLDFLENVAAIELEKKIFATIPGEDEKTLRGLVSASQKDYSDSKLPVREEESAWDPGSDKVLLKHTAEDKDQHIRAYFKEAMDVTKCHEEVQQGDGNGAVLRYVATYQQKFSSSFAKDWLNDDASDYSVARRVLFSYHPLEPEMWLTIGQEQFPQISYGGTLKDFMVPTPEIKERPELIRLYEKCRWRRPDMPLIEFLRKTNDAGDPLRHLHQKYKDLVTLRAWDASGGVLSDKGGHTKFREFRAKLLKDYKSHVADADEPVTLAAFAKEKTGADVEELHDFVNNYKTRGEKLVAAGFYSMFNDKYFGQWLVLHKPFKKLQHFHKDAPDVIEKVPPRYRNFALAMHHAPEFWGNDDAIQEQMELEAHGAAHIKTVISKVGAQRRLVRRYLDGELAVTEEATSDEELPQYGTKKRKVKLTRSQKRLARKMEARTKNAVKVRDTTDEEEYERLLDEANKANRIIFGNGPPGTGKTFVVHQHVKRWKRKGARILFALPTGQLASRIRAVHPDIDVDTCHGAMLFHRPLSEAMAILSQYDLVIIDEISMLTAEQFERVVEMWKAADKLPCLVLLGDFWQLPVVDREAKRCEESRAWKPNVEEIEFHEQVRCKDKTLQKKLNALRTSVPSVKKVKTICRGHRAWKTKEPEAYDILNVMRDTKEKTTIVTCTRRGAAKVNELAKKVLFDDRRKQQIGEIPCDYKANDANYDDKGKLKKKVKLAPAEMAIYKGLRVYLTKNLNKKDDFVNGMQATVVDYDEASQCLEVITKTKKRLAVHLYTEDVEGHGRVTYFPVRLGYACTVQKVQGATLDHITLWLDVPGCRAAAYVALSRVEYDANYLIGGVVCPRHFVPAM